ncbi:MAG: GNAT family N-acetyltransferase, partial [Negativibacillus sp.]|nr:GNAT family N-acetyltransferase [Negativibacillus sp.]
TISNRHHRKGYALEALSALIEHLHPQALDWEWICFVEPENTPSISLLKKLGYQDLGYIPSKDSLAFGKWVKEDTVEEFRRASQRGGKGREE